MATLTSITSNYNLRQSCHKITITWGFNKRTESHELPHSRTRTHKCLTRTGIINFNCTNSAITKCEQTKKKSYASYDETFFTFTPNVFVRVLFWVYEEFRCTWIQTHAHMHICIQRTLILCVLHSRTLGNRQASETPRFYFHEYYVHTSVRCQPPKDETRTHWLLLFMFKSNAGMSECM